MGPDAAQVDASSRYLPAVGVRPIEAKQLVRKTSRRDIDVLTPDRLCTNGAGLGVSARFKLLRTRLTTKEERRSLCGHASSRFSPAQQFDFSHDKFPTCGPNQATGDEKGVAGNLAAWFAYTDFGQFMITVLNPYRRFPAYRRLGLVALALCVVTWELGEVTT